MDVWVVRDAIMVTTANVVLWDVKDRSFTGTLNSLEAVFANKTPLVSFHVGQ